MSQMFAQPEEKLWIVVQDYQQGMLNATKQESSTAPKKGIKLEKNSVLKFGRVRLRVRDIDYPIANKTQKSPFMDLPKRVSSANKYKLDNQQHQQNIIRD